MRVQSKTALTYYEIVELITRFVERFERELEEIEEIKGNSNHSIELRLHVKSELEKLRTGYSCPDLRQKKVLARLRDWDRSVDGIPGFTMAVFKSKPPPTQPMETD